MKKEEEGKSLEQNLNVGIPESVLKSYSYQK